MQTYNEKDFRVLKLIATGNWHAIVIADVEVLSTLSVSGYIQISAARTERHQISLLPKGRYYLEQLQQLSVGKPEATGWAQPGPGAELESHYPRGR